MSDILGGEAVADEPSISRAEIPSPAPQPGSSLSGQLQDLTDRARSYVEAASSIKTRKAYASDWKHFSAWCRRSNLPPPPHPQAVGLYITACASGTAERGMKANSVATIERRLSSISWNHAQRGLSLDRKDRHIATVMAGIRNSHGRPPVQKEAVMATDVIAMLKHSIAALRVVCATGRCCWSATQVDAGAPRSSASISRWIRPKTAVAGSKSSIRACSSLAWQDRMAGGRDRPRLSRCDLPGRRS